jgi:hypothetical protein
VERCFACEAVVSTGTPSTISHRRAALCLCDFSRQGSRFGEVAFPDGSRSYCKSVRYRARNRKGLRNDVPCSPRPSQARQRSTVPAESAIGGKTAAGQTKHRSRSDLVERCALFLMPNTLINVSNRLPVAVKNGEMTKSSGGLVAALEGLPKGHYEQKWIGWPGAEITDKKEQKQIARKLADEYACIPVFIGKDEAAGFYEGFSNSSIWPLLHYLPNYLRYEPEWWAHYQKVNQTFADKVLEIAKDGDLVWVHDYQLMLLPAILRAQAPKLRIGFFLHTPFPAPQVFRFHPRCRELVAGMLGANRIGFHAFNYLRHFSGAVRRLLRIETELTSRNFARDPGFRTTSVPAAPTFTTS